MREERDLAQSALFSAASLVFFYILKMNKRSHSDSYRNTTHNPVTISDEWPRDEEPTAKLDSISVVAGGDQLEYYDLD